MLLYKKVVLSEPIKCVRFVQHELAPVPLKEHEDAIEAAYQRGIAETTQQFNTQIEAINQDIARLQKSILEPIQTKFNETLSEINTRLPYLIIELVKRLCGGVELQETHVQTIIRESLLEISPHAEKIEVTLCPEDFELANKHSNDLKNEYPGVLFFEDASLFRGDCKVESKFGKINATIQTKLERLQFELTN